MRVKCVAAAVISAAVLTGCSSTTGGSPQPAGVDASSTASRSATTTTTSAEPQSSRVPVIIEGDTGDYLDRLAQDVLDSLVTFWDGEGAVTEPMEYSFWESGKGEKSPTCAKETYQDGMFCNFTKGKKTDFLSWDKTYFGTIVNNPKVGAKPAAVLLLGHEYAHSVQAATGHYTDNANRELQADCLAGVFAKHYASNVTDDQWASATLVVFEDPDDPGNYDIVREHTKAFSEGWYKNSASRCNSYTG